MVLLSFFSSEAVVLASNYFAVVGFVVAVPLLVQLVRLASNKPLSLGDGVTEPLQVPGVPILGNMLQLLSHKHERLTWITSLCEQHNGRPFQINIPGRPPMSLVYTVKGVEDVLKTKFEALPKGPWQRGLLKDLLGHGIFAVDDGPWFHQRKTASNLFTARALRDTMTESMRNYAVVLQRILHKACDERATIDVFKLMNRFTIEAFAKMGFGIEMNCLESDIEHPFQSAFDSAQRVLVSRIQRPVWFWKFQRMINCGNEAQLKKDIDVINSTVMKIIAESLERRQLQQQGVKVADSADIVSLFLDRFDSSNGQEFDPTYLRDIVVNFLIAGRDTTAQAMSWCFYNLHKYPEVVKKIRQELLEVLPEFATGRDPTPPTMEQVQQLTYLDATLKETLRLHPSVPMIPKTVTEDMILSDGTFLRKGSLVALSPYAMGRMEFIWGTDAKQFNPDRWIDPTTGKLRNVSPFQFVSFNAGPRMCLGMNLAMLEMKIVMASVISRFDVEFTSPDTIWYDNSLTLPVRGNMLARVTLVTSP